MCCVDIMKCKKCFLTFSTNAHCTYILQQLVKSNDPVSADGHILIHNVMCEVRCGMMVRCDIYG